MIDASIYKNLQPLDVMGSVQRGLSMADMINEKRKQAALKDAFGKSIVQNPDGTTTIDQNSLISNVGKVSPEKAFALNQAFEQQKLAEQKLIADKEQRLLERDDTIFGQKLKEKELGLRYAELGDRKAQRQFEQDQSLATPYGLARTKEDAKILKSADEEKRTFDSKLGEMISLREKHGGGAILNREDVARGKQLSKDLLLTYKNMAKLGVLSAADEAIINAIIPKDPLEYNSPLAAAQGQDPILNNLKRFQADSQKDFENKLSNRLRPEGGAGMSRKPSGKKDVSGITPEAAAAELARRKKAAAAAGAKPNGG